MKTTLVVVRAFGAHAPGDVIDDEARMQQVLDSEHAGCVVRVAAARMED